MISSLHFTKPEPTGLAVWLAATATALFGLAGAQTLASDPSPELPEELEGCKVAQIWSFEDDTCGWTPGQRVAPLKVAQGRLVIRNVGEDPHVIGPEFRAEASKYQFLGMRARSSSEGLTQVFYTLAGDTSFDEKHMLPLEVCGDGGWHTYQVDLRSIEGWKGTITGLRIDPVNGLTEVGATTEIDWIALYQTPPRMEALLPYWKSSDRLVIGFENLGGQDASTPLKLHVGGAVVGDLGRLESPGQATFEVDARRLPAKFWLEARLGRERIWRGRMCKPEVPASVASSFDTDDLEGPPQIIVGSGAALLAQGTSTRHVRLAPIASLTVAGPGKERTYYEFDVAPRQQAEAPLDAIRWYQERIEDPLIGTLACTTTIDGTNVRTALECSTPIEVLRFEGPRLLQERAPTHAILPGLEYLEAGEESSRPDWTGPGEAERSTPQRYKITVPLMAFEYDRASPGRSRAIHASASLSPPSTDSASLDDWLVKNAAEANAPLSIDAPWVAGLAWDIDNRRHVSPGPPTAEFVSRRNGLSYASVFLPSMPDVEENQRYASRPYALPALRRLQLETRFVLQEGTIESVFENEWLRALPRPPGLDWAAENEAVPQSERVGAGSREALERILEISMQAYTHTLFDASVPGWKTHVAIGEAHGYRNSIAAMVLGESVRAGRPEYASAVQLPPDAQIEDSIGGAHGFVDEEKRNAADEVLAKLQEDGGLGFEQTPEMTEKIEDFTEFYGISYADFGVEGETNAGFTALRILPLLEYAACTREPKYVAAALRALKKVNSFTVPRGSQTWEIHMQTPDLYASAQGVSANLWGYRITGERSYVDEAMRWARTGLPFIYMWQPPNGERVAAVQVADEEGEGAVIAERDPELFYADVRREINPYASIPVFGTSWFAVTWFGIPVQWCGLAWGNAIRELDQVRPVPHLVRIADGIFRSAANQQCDTGYLAGTLPDSWEVETARSRQPYIVPDRILEYAYRVLDVPYLGALEYERIDGASRTHVASRALLGEPRVEGSRLTVTARFFAGQNASVLIGGGNRPSEVRVNGQGLPAGTDPGKAEWIPGSAGNAVLLVHWVASGAEDTIEVLE